MTEQEFEYFASGDEIALQQFFKAHYGYVTGWLIYREKCPQDRVGEFYTDALLRELGRDAATIEALRAQGVV